MNFIKQILKIWNSLEIHNSTKDVEDGMKSLLIKKKIRRFAFWTTLVIVSAFAFYGTLNAIKEDKFRANLIETKKVNPAMTFMYSKHEDEKKVLEAAIAEKQEEYLAIQKGLGSVPISGAYSFNDFLKDAKEGKVELNFGPHMRGNKAFREYQVNIYLSRLVQDKNQTVNLNNAAYTYTDISKKLRTERNKDKQLEMLRAPSVRILEKWNMFVSEDTIREMSKAIKKLDRLGLSYRNFYKELELDPDNAFDAIKNAMLAGKKQYEFINKKGGSYNTPMNTQWMFDEFELVRAEKEEARQKAYITYKEKEKKVSVEVNGIHAQIAELNRGVRLVQSLQTDVMNYESHEGNLTILMGELNKRGEISWNN